MEIETRHRQPRFERGSGELLENILRLGNVFELDFPTTQVADLDAQLEFFSNDWKQYNPYKPQNPRQGLSVTSLDGGISGKPDLYSLREYYKREGQLYKERDFNTLTPVFHKCTAIQPLISHFYPHIGRTHFLKLNPGGYFPPHRDGAGPDNPDTFRIFVPLRGTHKANFVFIFNEDRITFDVGHAYFINTLVKHSLFAFSSPATMLICNVVINEESFRLLKSKMCEQ